MLHKCQERGELIKKSSSQTCWGLLCDGTAWQVKILLLLLFLHERALKHYPASRILLQQKRGYS